MPNSDTCHPAVIAALEKDSCTITGEQVYVKRPDTRIYIDLEAMKGSRHFYVEVKCFPEANRTAEFYIALGQCLVYRRVIAAAKLPYTLYLAIPENSFNALGETYRETLLENHVKIIVVNMEREVITQWIE